MANTNDRQDELLDRNLTQLGPKLALPDEPTALQRARWKQPVESPAWKGIQFMKRHKLFSIGSAIAATVAVSVLVMNLTAPRVSAAEIFHNFKQAVGQSVLLTFKVAPPDEDVQVEGKLFARKRAGKDATGRDQDVYVELQVTAAEDHNQLAGLDVQVEASFIPEQEWAYVKFDGLPQKALQEEPMLAIFGAMAQNGVLLKLDGLADHFHQGLDEIRTEIFSELEEAAEEIAQAEESENVHSRRRGPDAADESDDDNDDINATQAELARALKDVIKGKGAGESLSRLIAWLEQHAEETSVERRGGVHILTAKGFAEIVGDEDISDDDRSMLEDMTVQIAYTRKAGVQWAKLELGEIASIKLDLSNPAIDPDLFSSDRYSNDGKTQVLDLSAVMSLLGPHVRESDFFDEL